MKNVIELELLAIDFKDTEFTSPYNCAISKACKRQLQPTRVVEFCTRVKLDDLYYKHQCYGYVDFGRDKAKAERLNFDNTVIKTLTLTEI